MQASKWNTIFRNSGIVLFANFIAKVLIFLATALIARTLQPDDFGWYALIIAYVGFIAVIPELGMDAVLTRDMARNPQVATTLLGASFTLRMLAIMLSGIVGMIVFFFLGYPTRLTPIFAIALTFVLSFSLSAFVETHFRAQMSMGLPALAKICAKATFFLVVFVALRTIAVEWRLLAAIAATTLPDLLAVAWVTFWMWHRVRPSLAFGWHAWRSLLHESWPFALSSICIMIYVRMDVVLLSQMSTPEAVGNYAAAYGLVEVWSGTATALGISLLPILSRSAGKDGANDFWRIYRQSFAGLMFVLLPMLFFFTRYASEIITLIYGSQYNQAYAALRLLIWGQFFAASSVIYTSALIADHRQKLVLSIAFISAIVNVIGNFILIPRLSIVGASLTTIIAYSVGSVMLFFLPDTRRYILPIFGACLFPGIASLVSICVVMILNLGLVPGLIVGGVIYLLMVVMLARLAGDTDRATLKPL
jgi:PST family polysaccharide transporter